MLWTNTSNASLSGRSRQLRFWTARMGVNDTLQSQRFTKSAPSLNSPGADMTAPIALGGGSCRNRPARAQNGQRNNTQDEGT